MFHILFYFMVASEEGFEHMEVRLPLHCSYGSGERDAFRACFDTVLCHATFSDTADCMVE